MFKEKTPVEKLKVIDFGLASRTDVQHFIYLKCGTPGFLAPEVANLSEGQYYNEKCDLFSIGCIMFKL
jgi:serine/threonine protein kinase